MDSFEDVGVSPELVEALAAAGIERPTALQEAAIPVVRRDNNLVLAAGPGAGTLLAWAVPLLERVPAEGDAPGVLALTPTAAVAERLAESLGLLAGVTGHVVAALGSPWALPQRAHVLFGTPQDVLDAIRGGALEAGGVRAAVLTEASTLAGLGGLDAAEAVLECLPDDAQRIVVSLPLSPPVTDFVKRLVKKSTTIPPQRVGGGTGDAPPHRGSLSYHVTTGPPESAVLSAVAELLDGDLRHVVVFCRSEDRAADVGDYLTLRGYLAGAPGDSACPVWLGVDALAVRGQIEAHSGVGVVSADVPTGPDELDRRHGFADRGVIVVFPRELEHLRAVATETGYLLTPRTAREPEAMGEVHRLRARLREALKDEDVAPYLLALEPLFEERDPSEVAAAAVALLRRVEAGRSAARPTDPAPAGTSAAPAAPAWAKLFVSVGERDGLRPGDLVGAITGEANVPGESVGKIEIRESHSLVEVHDAVARSVIRALNGTTIKGRAVRVDYDRPRQARSPGRTGGGRPGGPGRR